MSVWWCNQSDQWEVELRSQAVCSSDTSVDGGNVTYRKTVGEVMKGDLVVHYRKSKVIAFSRASEDGSRHDRLPLLEAEDYGAGWRFRTEYFVLNPKAQVSRESFVEQLIPLRFRHCPIDRRGFIRQGYFFPFDLKGLSVILSMVKGQLPDWLESYLPGHPLLPEEITDSSTLFEGSVSRITVNAYERNLEARRRCIERYGARCDACELDFGAKYGEVAEGLIHVHHLRLISEIGERYVIDPIADLRPVCPNCHAVIHLRSDRPFSIGEVKQLLARSRKDRSN